MNAHSRDVSQGAVFMIVSAIALVFLGVLTSCENSKPQQQQPAEVPTAYKKPTSSEVLFVDEDGYKVKRFRDHNEWHYYAVPGDKTEVEDKSVRPRAKTKLPDPD